MTKDKIAKYALGELTLHDVFEEYEKLFGKFSQKYQVNNALPKGVQCLMDVYFNDEICEDWYTYEIEVEKEENPTVETILTLMNYEGTVAEIPMSTKVKFYRDIIFFTHDDEENNIEIKFRMVHTERKTPKNPFAKKMTNA